MACTDVAKVKAKATAINLIILSSNSNKVNLQDLPAQSRLFCALDCSQIAKSILRLRGAFSGPRPWAFPGLLKRWGMEWGTLPGNTRKALSINRPWRCWQSEANPSLPVNREMQGSFPESAGSDLPRCGETARDLRALNRPLPIQRTGKRPSISRERGFRICHRGRLPRTPLRARRNPI